MKYFRRVVSGAKEDAEKVFRPDFCALRGSDSGAGGGGCPSLASKEGTGEEGVFNLWTDHWP